MTHTKTNTKHTPKHLETYIQNNTVSRYDSMVCADVNR